MDAPVQNKMDMESQGRLFYNSRKPEVENPHNPLPRIGNV